jgi:hypothetical protein
VSRLDDQLRKSLRNLAADILPDPDDLATVHERAVQARRRERWAVPLGALAVAGVVAVVIVVLSYATRHGQMEPVEPTPSPTVPTSGALREPTNPFKLLRTIEAATVRMDGPLKLAVGSAGQVYVTDVGQHVTELSATGDVVRQWGGRGTAPGQFRMYSGAVAVGPDGHVYVADTGNFRIQVFTAAGRFIAQYGGYGLGPGRFVWPSDIVVGSDGTMYVADDRAATITALSPSGQQLWRRGTPAESDPNLIGHQHLAGVNASGQLVTTNDDVGRVLYLNPDGRVVDFFNPEEASAGVDASGILDGHFPSGSCATTFDAQGNVYVSSCEESYEPTHDTAVYDTQHRFVAGWKRGNLVDAPVFGPDGHAWAITSGNRTIVELEVHLPGS